MTQYAECADDPTDVDAAAMRNLFGLGAVHVMPVSKDGVAYVGLECGCEWDEEHGFGVLLHQARVVAAGQADDADDFWAALQDAGLTMEQWEADETA